LVQLRSALEIFLLLHDNAPAHKATSVCQFLTPQKCYNPLSSAVLPTFISARLFLLKGLHFPELKKTQKEEFSAAFQKLYHRAKACIYANAAYFEFKKKGMCRPHMSSILTKKSVLKLIDRTAYFFSFIATGRL
jgi:hypothetical protein